MATTKAVKARGKTKPGAAPAASMAKRARTERARTEPQLALGLLEPDEAPENGDRGDALFAPEVSPEPSGRRTRGSKSGGRGASNDRSRTAQELAGRQRSISVSEFFLKNRHLLGFDNPAKALLTTVKEAVDNSLDACEEAGILPEISIEIKEITEDRFRIAVEDNGPGIVKQQVPRIFGQLLYGSRFHSLRQSRGQQGIGISAAGMYAQLTTGKPTLIITRPGAGRPAHRMEVRLDARRNVPEVLKDDLVEWHAGQGTRVELEIEALYKRGRRSVDDYIEQTALVNPHARFSYAPPRDPPVTWERLTDEMPRETREIKPHPHGVELGALLQMLQETKARDLLGFMTGEFSRVTERIALDIAGRAGVPLDMSPHRVKRETAERLHKALGATRLMAPPTHCLAPLGEAVLRAGLSRRTRGQFMAATSRPPAVYRGYPFQVEAALAWGDPELGADEPVTLMRFANRVPLLYQQAACAVTRGATTLSWKNYGLSQPRGALPIGPLVVVVHIASVWVPFTSESKEAIASYPEILREVTLALQACGRELGIHLRRRKRLAEAEKKQQYLDKYIPHVGIALREILSLSEKQETEVVTKLRATLAKSRE
jgi:DNA topoisomerase VI subunit B